MAAAKKDSAPISDEDAQRAADVLANKADELTVVHAALSRFQGNDAVCIADKLKSEDAQRIVNKLSYRISLGLDAPFRRRALWIISMLGWRKRTLPPSAIILNSITQVSEGPYFVGAFSEVHTAMYELREVAIKEPFYFGDDNGVQAQEVESIMHREASIWTFLKHSNIIPLLGVSRTVYPPFLSLVSPWQSFGHLLSYMTKFPNANRLKLIEDIASGLRFMHSWGVIHGDIKPTNILVTSDHRACLTDFGLSFVDDCGDHKPRAGNAPIWKAPELSDEQIPSPKSDVYAFGMVAWQLFSGERPFRELNLLALILKDPGMRPARPAGAEDLGLSDDCWHLITQCWRDAPDARPSSEDICTISHELCLQFCARNTPQEDRCPKKAPRRIDGCDSLHLGE